MLFYWSFCAISHVLLADIHGHQTKQLMLLLAPFHQVHPKPVQFESQPMTLRPCTPVVSLKGRNQALEGTWYH